MPRLHYTTLFNFAMLTVALSSLFLVFDAGTTDNMLTPGFFMMVNAANITPTKATFYPADFEVAAPTVITTYRGEPVIGVNTSLGCGYADPIGNFTDPQAYFRFNYTTPEEYMYRVGFRSYAPDVLSNSIWFFFEENVLKAQGDVNKDSVDISKTNANGDFMVDTPLCLHIAGDSNIPNTFTIRPREPGVLIAELWFEMIPQPKILSVVSRCGGDCNKKQPIPIRITFDEFVCAATDFHEAYGSVVIKGPGGKHTCYTLDNQLQDSRTGKWYTDCVIPTNVSKQKLDELSASVFWPTSQHMPALAAPIKVDVAFTPPSILPIVLGIVLPVAFLIVVGVVYYFYRKDKKMRENVRDLENAPKNAETPIGIIFTDIQGSTALWSTAPLSMSAALETHNKIINEIIAVHEGYYVKSAGDSFFIAYDCTREGGAATAAKICVEIQRQILEATYPAAINKIYNAEDEFELLDVVDDPNVVDNYPGDGAIWNGLRVRIGLAIGTCQVKFDEVAKSYDPRLLTVILSSMSKYCHQVKTTCLLNNLNLDS